MSIKKIRTISKWKLENDWSFLFGCFFFFVVVSGGEVEYKIVDFYLHRK